MASTTRPNILILHADQLRYDGLGCNGSAYATTPNIDRIAARGIRFTRHIVSNPICQPSRATLFTGLYPHAHGLWCNGPALLRNDHAPGTTDWVVQGDDASFTAAPPTIGDYFAAAGYATAAFGKLHLQPMGAAAERGFEESFGMWKSGAMDGWNGPFYGFDHVEFCLSHHETGQVQYGHYAAWLRERAPDLVESIVENPPEGEYQFWPGPIPHELHNTSWLAERVDAYLESAAASEDPFLAFVGFPGPHHPLSPSHDIMERFESMDPGVAPDPEGAFLEASAAHGAHTKWPPAADLRDRPELLRLARVRTAAMIHQIDEAVGRIIDSLERTGMLDSTIVVVTSDHGDFLGEHGLLFKHLLTAHSLTHVPFLIAGPGVPRGEVDDRLMGNIDVLPTLLDLAGADPPAYQQGRSFATGSRLESSAAPVNDEGVLVCSYGPLLTGVDRRVDNLSLYTDRYRYTWYPRLGTRELFDHEADPAETVNLAADESNANVVTRLHAQLASRYMDTSVPGGARHALF